ncbi:UNVERIFIED_ORG: hypothetical protein M2348_001349 [Sphingomonas sp. R1F5B]
MNLFDVHQGCHNMNPKPRAATADEMRAYLDWLAERDGVHVPPGAEYHLAGIWLRTECRYIVPMPGYGQAQVATCEVLDNTGAVVRTITLPQDKRGGIPATAKQVRDWCGLEPVKAKRGKRGAPTVDKAPVQAAQGAQEALVPTCVAPEPANASEQAPAPEISAIEPVSDADKLPVPIDLADMAARLEALERTIAALSVARTVAPTADAAPAAPSRAKRTPAHERAIRRAWAERAARRAAAVEIARLEGECMDWKAARRRAVLTAQRHWRMRLVAREQYRAAERGEAHQVERRRAAVERARRMIAAARQDAERQANAARVARADLAKMRQAMADPSQPERASDLARLVQERDQARTALAAVTARADRQQSALDQMAGQFEAMVSRVTRAEAAMRKLGIAA